MTKEVTKAGVEVGARERMESTLNEVAQSARRETKAARKDAEETAQEILTGTRTIAGQCVRDVESTIRDAMADFARRDLTGMEDQRLIEERSALEAPIRKAFEDATRRLDALRSQLASVNLKGDSSLVDQLEAVEQSNVTLREQAAADLQLAQLGMAIEIISHEFGAAIRSVRLGLRSLKAWADVNQELDVTVSRHPRQLRPSRRLPHSLHTASKEALPQGGGHSRLGNPRVSDQSVRPADGTTQHRTGQDRCVRRKPPFGAIRHPSTPCSSNLVDNAIYWLAGQNERLERLVQLDASGKGVPYLGLGSGNPSPGPGRHLRHRVHP